MSRILHNKFQWRREDVADAVDLILGFTNYVHPDETLDVVKTDPDDNRALECAVKARSTVLVSGDRDLLALRAFRGIEVVSVADFLQRVV